MKNCKTCQGLGKTVCGTCGTSGRERVDGEMQTCRTCTGKGGFTCRTCGGSGRRYES
jgi:hypothetical protein